MTTSTTNHTSVTGPDQNRFGILGTNIVVRLLAYYLAIGAVSWLVPRMLPGSLRELLRQATTPLLGLAPTGDVLVGTPDPTIAALPPTAVILMGIIAVVSAVLLCLPVSWTYMFTRQKKGYSQTIVHTLLLSREQGFLLHASSVVRGGPAANAGVAPGDVITAIDGRKISSSSSITAAILAKKPGAKVTIRITDRTGAARSATVTLASGPAQ